MIRVRKPSQPPEVLRTRGRQLRKNLCAAHERGERVFEFNAAVYNHSQVRKALYAAQHGKCAYCESKVGAGDYGDVDHFRPKAGWAQSAQAPLQTPGYYWLAYEWRNLFLACQRCNGQYKRNLFPLRNPGRRARHHRAPLTRESPLLVDPGEEEPEAFISFREDVPIGIDAGSRGEATIQVLGLRREPLGEERRKRLKIARALLNFARRRGAPAEESRVLLRDFQHAREPYAAMIRALLRKEAPDLLDEAHRAPSMPRQRKQRLRR